MENIIGTEICAGFTERLVKVVQYLELPNTRSIYNAPFEIICWIWFMAYVVNIKIHHNRTSFRNVHVSTLFKALRANYSRFLEVTESYCDAFFTRQLFAIEYSSDKGFYLITKTTVWRELICSITGKCYSMPDSIADTLDKMGFPYFHDNGLLVGPIAFINHQCDCQVSYGFDWQKLKKRKSRSSLYRVTDIVPVYLSWDFARVDLTKDKPLPMHSEIVVKYFEPDDYFAFVNMNDWFDDKCQCANCSQNRSVDMDSDYYDVSKVLTVDLASAVDHMSLMSYNASISKRFKQRAMKKTMYTFSKRPQIIDPVPHKTLTNVVNPFDLWCRDLLLSEKAKKLRLE